MEYGAHARLRYNDSNYTCLQYFSMNYNQFEFVLFDCKSHATVVSTYNKVQDNINIVSANEIHVRIPSTCV